MAMLGSEPGKIAFKDMAGAFHIIEEQTQAIIVPYGQGGKALIEDLRKGAERRKHSSGEYRFLPREMQRRAQLFSVPLREGPFAELQKAGVLEDVFEDGQYWVLTNGDIYKEGVGLCPGTPEFMETESLIL